MVSAEYVECPMLNPKKIDLRQCADCQFHGMVKLDVQIDEMDPLTKVLKNSQRVVMAERDLNAAKIGHGPYYVLTTMSRRVECHYPREVRIQQILLDTPGA